jgi:steroid 5-alpha reductase family enzyme
MSAVELVEHPRGLGRGASFARVAAVYLVAFVVAVLTAVLFDEGAHLHAGGLVRSFSILAAADLAATLVVFAASLFYRNSSLYDAYWSVAPLAFVLGHWALGAPLSLRSVLYVAVLALWAVRLTFNWARGWGGLDHEDFRYRDLQRKFGGGVRYWLVSFAGLHLFPTLIVLAGLLPSPSIFGGTAPLGPLDLAGAAVMLLGVGMQATADEQLKRFVARRVERDAICEDGLWAYSRHPNYFGEVCIWTGPVLLALGSGEAQWWTPLGAGAIVALFLFASIPLMEARQARKPGWAEYRRRVSMLVPWPRR